MAQQSTDENKLAQQKRDMARRARRLAQSQLVQTDRARLAQFADELDKEAEALERLATSVSLPPPCGATPTSAAAADPAATIG
jgi:hypothetical protein